MPLHWWAMADVIAIPVVLWTLVGIVLIVATIVTLFCDTLTVFFEAVFEFAEKHPIQALIYGMFIALSGLMVLFHVP